MASLVERGLPMLSQSVAISSKLSSFQTSDVGEAKRQGEGRGPLRPPKPSSPSKKDRFDDDDCNLSQPVNFMLPVTVEQLPSLLEVEKSMDLTGVWSSFGENPTRLTGVKRHASQAICGVKMTASQAI
ncbi:hypothetical protein Patl1_06568 [Pistacia atlantica]|uniref:Uncharacterized protein n=1 Tax=Pistacia atlantica TaxID=434234 RepID=A0ACC1BWE3_9ROSI|nr:hypothetical protein Patl1_06568 [Pistacia atlantica]